MSDSKIYIVDREKDGAFFTEAEPVRLSSVLKWLVILALPGIILGVYLGLYRVLG